MPRMVRQDWHELIGPMLSSGVHVFICSCGESLWCQASVREHWQMGHLDTVHPHDLPPDRTEKRPHSDDTARKPENNPTGRQDDERGVTGC